MPDGLHVHLFTAGVYVQWGAVWKAGEIIDGQQPQQTLVAHMKRHSLLPSVQTLKGLLSVQMLKGLHGVLVCPAG